MIGIIRGHFYCILICAALSTFPGSISAQECLAAADVETDKTVLPEGLSGQIYLHSVAAKSSAYPGEAVPLTIKLSYADDLSVRDIGYPSLPRTGLAYEGFGNPVHGGENISGRLFKTVIFSTRISAERPGPITVGPARIGLKRVVPADKDSAAAFFGDVETVPVELISEPVRLVILPFPDRGKPQGFRGAVGEFDIDVNILPVSVNVGDPVTIKVTISGKGNIESVVCPSILAGKGLRNYGMTVERKVGKTICEEVIVPLDASINMLPPITFSYFDPVATSYITLKKGPYPLEVVSTMPSSAGAVSPLASNNVTAAKDGTGSSRSGFSKNTASFPSLVILLLLASAVLGLLIYLTSSGYGSRRKKAKPGKEIEPPLPKRYRVTLEDVQKAYETCNPEQFYNQLFRALQDLLGERCGINPGSVTEGVVIALLEPDTHGLTEVKEIVDLFEQCNLVRYAGFRAERADMEGALAKLKEISTQLKSAE